MTHFWQDAAYGIRMILKKPGFTAIAALSLAFGIGANTVVFSLINSTLLRPLGFPDPGRLMVIWTVPLQHKDQRNNVNVSSYFAFRDRSRTFSDIGAFNGGLWVLGAEQNGQPAERVFGETFTPSLFRAVGVKPILGRLFTDEEDPVGADPAPVVLVSYRFWQRHFNGARDVVGKTLVLDKVPVTVIGVLPKDFSFFNDEADLWAPQPIGRLQQLSKQGFLVAIGRLKPGVSIRQAQVEMDTLAAQLASGDPERNQGKGAVVQPLQEAAYGYFRLPLLILQGAVGFVLLIGCANVAGLLLARATSRRTEIAIRSALGAGRARVVRQLITETLPLSLLGGLAGVALAWAGLKGFAAAAPPNFPRADQIALDPRVLGFTALLVLLTAVIFSIVPAIQASNPDLVNSLKESSRGGSESGARQRLRSALVTFQIALALVLLIGAGLMINSFVRVETKDIGADPKGILTFDFRFPQAEAIKPFSRYRGMGLWDVSPMTTLTFQRVFERVQAIPGVVSAAAISTPPLVSDGINMPFLIEGRPAPPPSSTSGDSSQEQGQSASYFAITPNYFATMKIPVLRGRDFNAQDTAAAPSVIIVNQTFAKRFLGGENPIGKRITLDFVPDEKPRQIVAVVGDTTVNRLQDKQTPMVYVPYTQQTPRWMGPWWSSRAGIYFLLRTSGKPTSIVTALRRAVSEIDANKPAAEIRTLEDYLDRQVQYLRLYIFLLGIFGGIAAALAAIGIYGVMAYSVAERTREIGIRMALGADARAVLALVARQAVKIVVVGLALGLAGSFALTRVIKSALVGVTPTDPATYISVSLALALVALIACFVPTRRAVAVEPTSALRYE